MLRIRPVLHHTRTRGWLNDPYAVTWDGTRYRMLMQVVPGSTSWAAACAWGAATSPDLVHWDEGPVVLSPRPFEAGCWSGCEVPGFGAFYTRVVAGDPEHASIAVARWSGGRLVSGVDDVVVRPPSWVRAFRDPYVLGGPGDWTMLVGAGLTDDEAAVLRYRSADLTSWAYDGVLARLHSTGRPVAECPQLIRVDDAWVLLVSLACHDAPGEVYAAVGDGTSFGEGPDPWQRLAAGGSAYATTAFRDRDDRPCVISWLRDGVPVTAADGWAGAQSLPAVLTLTPTGRVTLRPHPALDATTGAAVAVDGVLPPAVRLRLDPAVTTAVTFLQDGVEELNLPVTGPADVVLDADVVETYGERYGAYRLPPLRGERGLRFAGGTPVCYRIA